VVAPPWMELPPTGYGGIEAVCADLIAALRRGGHRVTLVGVGRNGTGAAFVQTYDRPQSERIGQTVPEVVHAAALPAILADLHVGPGARSHPRRPPARPRSRAADRRHHARPGRRRARQLLPEHLPLAAPGRDLRRATDVRAGHPVARHRPQRPRARRLPGDRAQGGVRPLPRPDVPREGRRRRDPHRPRRRCPPDHRGEVPRGRRATSRRRSPRCSAAARRSRPGSASTG
jgi:hypothetical protein